jgi:hypothetical protein
MTTDQTTPSRRAGLRDEIVNALGRIKTVPPVAHRREQADHVLAVLYRAWPWLRAEAEEARLHDPVSSVGQAAHSARGAVLREAADYAEATAEMLRSQREFKRSAGALDVMTVLRRLADETQQRSRSVAGSHVYLSTGCLHGDCDYCQNKDGRAGPKEPGQCKHCGAHCICSCHTEHDKEA